MKTKTWKVIAIIFISLFIVETLLIVWVSILGNNSIKAKYQCSDVCYEESGFFHFDATSNLCSCINSEGTVDRDFIIR